MLWNLRIFLIISWCKNVCCESTYLSLYGRTEEAKAGFPLNLRLVCNDLEEVRLVKGSLLHAPVVLLNHMSWKCHDPQLLSALKTVDIVSPLLGQSLPSPWLGNEGETM